MRYRLSIFCLMLGATLLPGTASGIVTRHDIADAAYLAKESEFPALFAVYQTKAGHKECIATVISPRWAVTAAHCAREGRLLDATSPGGEGYAVEVAGKAALVDKVIHHPGTGDERAPDIALLRFRAPISHVAPLPIYRSDDEVGRIIAMPGWGGMGNGQAGLGVEDGLFRVAENIVDGAEAGRLFWRFDAPGPKSRALTLEGISGPGDSGGPALVKTPGGWAVAGISSSQDTKGGAEGRYGVDEYFVRVSKVAAWIDGHVLRAPAETSSD